MTFSLLGRFFAVPLLIIGTIVGGAVVVVLLFGGPAAPEQRSVDDLVQTLEANSGEKSLGLLLPREKEMWQAALELSVRLENKSQEPGLDEAKLASVAGRLGEMVRKDLAHLDALPTFGEQRVNQREVRSRRLEFLILALGRTEQPEAVQPLLEVMRSEQSPYVERAIQAFGALHDVPAARAGIDPIISVLRGTDDASMKLLACTVLSVLASGGDERVIEALREARLASDGEVAWSAALALARLGSDAGKSTLLDLLDRSFLESGDHYVVSDEAGVVRRYKLPPGRVNQLLIAAMNAASNLDDPEVWAMIEKLGSDESPAVRGRAAELLRERTS